MSDKKIIKEQLDEPVIVEMPPELTAVMEKILEKLDRLDLSIDYMTAALTGEDPLSISMSQSVGGRLNRPTPPRASQADLPVGDLDKSSFTQAIREEILKIINEGK